MTAREGNEKADSCPGLGAALEFVTSPGGSGNRSYGQVGNVQCVPLLHGDLSSRDGWSLQSLLAAWRCPTSLPPLKQHIGPFTYIILKEIMTRLSSKITKIPMSLAKCWTG